MEVLRVSFRNGEPTSPLRHAARDALRGRLTSRDEDTVDDALVVISELVQNVTQHTRSDGEFRLGVDERHVLIEVRDDDQAAPSVRPQEGLRAGGRGLLLVAGMAADWGVRRARGGKVVWARLAIAALAAAAA